MSKVKFCAFVRFETFELIIINDVVLCTHFLSPDFDLWRSFNRCHCSDTHVYCNRSHNFFLFIHPTLNTPSATISEWTTTKKYFLSPKILVSAVLLRSSRWPFLDAHSFSVSMFIDDGNLFIFCIDVHRFHCLNGQINK